jgi:hypothetical protein
LWYFSLTEVIGRQHLLWDVVRQFEPGQYSPYSPSVKFGSSPFDIADSLQAWAWSGACGCLDVHLPGCSRRHAGRDLRLALLTALMEVFLSQVGPGDVCRNDVWFWTIVLVEDKGVADDTSALCLRGLKAFATVLCRMAKAALDGRGSLTRWRAAPNYDNTWFAVQTRRNWSWWYDSSHERPVPALLDRVPTLIPGMLTHLHAHPEVFPTLSNTILFLATYVDDAGPFMHSLPPKDEDAWERLAEVCEQQREWSLLRRAWVSAVVLVGQM